jgi:hypothetical protein
MESLVAVVLFALAARAMGILFTQQFRMQGTNFTTTTAIALASKELEDLRALDYPNIASRSSTATTGAITYNIQTTVVADSPQPNLKTINASVTWTEPSGPKAYSLYAIYTDITR